MSDERELDVVVHGASGFVGRLVARHLAEHAPEGTRIGLSGRSRSRVADVRDRLGKRAWGWPVLVADNADPVSLTALVGSARVVATTVGPYTRYGLPLVEACAAAGTHYADLTGEVLFVHEAAERHHDSAVATGARIVTSCGFDSVPSDLAVLLLAERARADGAGGLTDTTLVVTGAKGGVSGGTIDSLRAMVATARNDPQARRLLADPYALSPDRPAEPDREPGAAAERDGHGIGRDDELGGWTAPFVMATYNTRIVRRSNALQDWAYGRGLRYREVMRTGRGPLAPVAAAGTAVGLAAAAAGFAFPPTRVLLDRVLPAPGEGPSEASMRSGYFRMTVHARTESGARYRAKVAATGDPGYAATAVMMGESALALALDGDRLPQRAGVLTPATGIGPVLVERLRAAGFTLEVERA